MSSTFTKILVQARKDAGLTQEKAAQQIGVALRTMANYEAGRIPTDAIVARMVQVYQSRYLGYAYLTMISETGQMILPPLVQIPGIAAGAMQLHLSIKNAVNVYERLERICCDDIITSDELTEFQSCTSELDNLVKRYVAMKLTAQKKSFTVTAVKLPKQEVF